MKKAFEKIKDIWLDFVWWNEGMAESFVGAYLLILLYGFIGATAMILLYEFVIK